MIIGAGVAVGAVPLGIWLNDTACEVGEPLTAPRRTLGALAVVGASISVTSLVLFVRRRRANAGVRLSRATRIGLAPLFLAGAGAASLIMGVSSFSQVFSCGNS